MNIPSPGAVQRTDPTKSEVSVPVNNSSMYRASCPLALQRNLRLFEHDAVFHQLATHLQGFLSQVADGGSGADSSRQAASREEGIPYGLAGSHSGHPLPTAVGGNRPGQSRCTPTRYPLLNEGSDCKEARKDIETTLELALSMPAMVRSRWNDACAMPSFDLTPIFPWRDARRRAQQSAPPGEVSTLEIHNRAFPSNSCGRREVEYHHARTF